MKGMQARIQPLLAALGGNLAGYAAFRAALWVTPLLWRSGAAEPGRDPGMRILLIVATAILFAAPPVLIGALAARLAGRARPWVGLAAGLWAIGFAWWWPEVPLLGPEAWVGPAVLVLISGLVGGWLIDQRAGLKALRAARPEAIGGTEDV